MQPGYFAATRVPSGLVLSQGELVLWYGRRTWKSLVLLIILGLLLLIAFGLGLIFLVAAVLLRYSGEFAVTNKRVYARAGILSRANLDTPLDKVTEIGANQGIFGRLLNYGDVFINTSGGGGLPIIGRGVLSTVVGKVVFRGVDNPLLVKGTIDGLREQYKIRERSTERLERLEDQLLVGQITREQYENARRSILSSLPPAAPINPPPPRTPHAPAINPSTMAQPPFPQSASADMRNSVGPRFCTTCGSPTVPGAVHCGSCGTRLL